MAKKGGKYAENIEAIRAGQTLAAAHPLIYPLPGVHVETKDEALTLPQDAWLVCTMTERRSNWAGHITDMATTVWPNIRRRADPTEWAWIFARMSLHIVMGHLDPGRDSPEWRIACCIRAEEMIAVAGIGRRPEGFAPVPTGLPRGDEAALASFLTQNDIPPDALSLTLGVPGAPFWRFEGDCSPSDDLLDHRRHWLAQGIRAAATAAIDVAGGARKTLAGQRDENTTVKRAHTWVMGEYPLLASLASSFTLIEDAELCERMGVEIAAISDATSEIYFNPRVRFDEEEARFVMAHELLHAGLRHTMRRQGRDPWLWNVACDYVINDWLIEMRIGIPPERIGYLHDPELRGLSSEEVYDRITGDLRLQRKLKKARGMNGGQPDMLEARAPGWWRGGGVDLDAFYRRALTEGLELHRGQGRGLLPAGLVEEIRALEQPPIPWDVKMAHWLDQYFPPLERRRSYARAHRRQSATPDIPRPAWIAPEEERAARVFGVLVDTSGSMSRSDLGKAIGAIASYGLSRDVGFVRMVQCDALPHDTGYLQPDALLERVEVRGRGGTVLMPGIRLLEGAEDFPKDAPILVITDGGCDRLTIRHEHAFLLPEGCRLPFAAKGPVFHFA